MYLAFCVTEAGCASFFTVVVRKYLYSIQLSIVKMENLEFLTSFLAMEKTRKTNQNKIL